MKNFLNDVIKGMNRIMLENRIRDFDCVLEVKVGRSNLEKFVFDFMNELLYIFSVKKLVPVCVKGLKPLSVYFKKFDREKMKILTEIKAVTRHLYTVKKTGGRYYLRVIFDV